MKKFILTILLTVTAMTMMAVPAKRGQWKTLTLQDGTEVRATLVGDEHGHFWKAENGQAYAERGGVWVAVDGQQIIKKAKARRAKVNAQRVKRRTFGHPTTILGKKKAIMILVNFKDKSFQSSHDNALFNRIANEEGLALWLTISKLRAAASSNWILILSDLSLSQKNTAIMERTMPKAAISMLVRWYAKP